jgi:hypothetical protein
VYKLIVIIAAAMPTILLLRSIFVGAVAKKIAGFRRIQEADRLSGMGDLVRYRLCFRLFGRKPDPLHVEMTLHQFHKKAATMAPDIELNSSSYGLDLRLQVRGRRFRVRFPAHSRCGRPFCPP